jgi:hypothetical protein
MSYMARQEWTDLQEAYNDAWSAANQVAAKRIEMEKAAAVAEEKIARFRHLRIKANSQFDDVLLSLTGPTPPPAVPAADAPRAIRLNERGELAPG